MEAVLLWLGAFAFGSIPFGYLIAKARGIDIRQVGSGNIGATNVERAMGKRAGAAVLVLDVLKGLVPPLIGWHLVSVPVWLPGSQEVALGAGMLAVIGHCFSPWLGFNGGKGVATGIGCLFGAVWPIALVVFATFVVFMIATRYVSLSSIAGSLSIIPASLFIGYSELQIGLLAALSLMVVWRHASNIQRLRAGTEKRFGARSSQPPENA